MKSNLNSEHQLEIEVADAFDAFAPSVRRRLFELRAMIFRAAAPIEGLGSIEETLKWGQPSYAPATPRVGSALRLGALSSKPKGVAVFFHCQSLLVPRFRELYGDVLHFEGNRSIVFEARQKIPRRELIHCLQLAFTYHRWKRGAEIPAPVALRRARSKS